MQPQTSVAATRDWLNAEREITLIGYIEVSSLTLFVGSGSAVNEQSYTPLEAVSAPVRLPIPSRARAEAAMQRISRHFSGTPQDEIERDIDLAVQEIRQGT